MSNMRYERPKRKKESKGFYLALIGCLAAIAAVTWTAVGNINRVTPEETESYSSQDTEAVDAEPNQYIDGFDWDEELVSEYNDVMEEVSSSQSVSSQNESTPETKHVEVKETAAKPIQNPTSSTSTEKEKEKETSKETVKAKSSNQQSYMLPAGNEIIKEYSGEELLYSTTMSDWRVHEGVDFKIDKNQMIRAAGDGEVKDIIQDPLYGTTVIIDHGELETHYCGLMKNISVEKGQEIKMGDDIGYVGEIPCESVEELHFHFGVKKDGKWVDPISALRK